MPANWVALRVIAPPRIFPEASEGGGALFALVFFALQPRTFLSRLSIHFSGIVVCMHVCVFFLLYQWLPSWETPLTHLGLIWWECRERVGWSVSHSHPLLSTKSHCSTSSSGDSSVFSDDLLWVPSIQIISSDWILSIKTFDSYCIEYIGSLERQNSL